jgi:hypothetical protein
VFAAQKTSKGEQDSNPIGMKPEKNYKEKKNN